MLLFLLAATISVSTWAGEPPSQHSDSELGTKAKRTLVDKALTLKAGDSYQTVTNRLGIPTYNTRHQNKNGSWIGRSLKYDFHSRGSDELEGAFTESVVIFLDGHDRLRYITLKVTLGDGSER
jgi:hypothetical protein